MELNVTHGEKTSAPPPQHAPPAWRWFRCDGWWGWRDLSSPLGDPSLMRSVLTGEAPAEVLNDRPGSRTFRLLESGDNARARGYVKLTSRSLLAGLTHLSEPRAWRVKRLLRKMDRRGIGVPRLRLVATRIGRAGFENVVVMDAVHGLSLTDVLYQPDHPDYQPYLRRVARAAARMHNQGFSHGDMGPTNIIFADDLPHGDPRSVVFIDNDRVRRVWGPWRIRARFRNVTQACFRIRVFGGWRDCRVFLHEYLSAAREPRPVLRWVRQAVLKKSAERYHHFVASRGYARVQHSQAPPACPNPPEVSEPQAIDPLQ